MTWDPDNQKPPSGDARYRIHKSVKCYVASMQCGTKWCTLTLDEGIQRVVYQFLGDSLKVLYKGNFHALRTPEQLERKVREHLALRGGVKFLGGILYHFDRSQKFIPFHFIDLTPQVDAEKYINLKPIWLRSDSFHREPKLNDIAVKLLPWSEIAEKHKVEVIDLLESAGEVQKAGLKGRLQNAMIIALTFEGDTVIGCGALKVQSAEYRKKVFDKSVSNLDPNQYQYELGYVAVSGKSRKKGIGSAIAKSLLNFDAKVKIYATTKSSNVRMQKVLVRNRFSFAGQSYQSDFGKHSVLLLTRDG